MKEDFRCDPRRECKDEGVGVALPNAGGSPADDGYRAVRTAADNEEDNGGNGSAGRRGDGVVDEAGVVLKGDKKPVPVLDVLFVLLFSLPRREVAIELEVDFDPGLV